MSARLLLPLLLLAAAVQAQDPPPARVVVATVEERELSPGARMVGVLRFTRVAEVAAEVEGLITRHEFDTGWTLEQGAVMAELNSDFIRKDMEINRSQAAEVEAQIEQLAREVERLGSLRRDNLASRSTYDEAYYAHQVLLKRRDTLKRQHERMQLALDKSRIRAPFQGIVLEKTKELGDWVDKGKSVARLGSTEGVQAVIPVSETLLPFQREGAEYEVHIPALGRHIKGLLSGLVPFAELRSKSVYLKIALPYEPGMIENLSVEAEVPAEHPRRLRLIPRSALLQSQGTAVVYTVADGKAVALPVNIVTRSGGFIAVDDEAITPGMMVIVDGNDRLRPGQAVQVVTP